MACSCFIAVVQLGLQGKEQKMAYKIPASSGSTSALTQLIVRNVSLISTGLTLVSGVPSGKRFIATSFSIITTALTGPVGPVSAATVSFGTSGPNYNNYVPSFSYNMPVNGFFNTSISIQDANSLGSIGSANFNVSAASAGATSYLVDIFLTGFYTT